MFTGYIIHVECCNIINKTKKQSSKELVIENNNGKSKQEKDTNLILIKKKVTTHYVPPDLTAVKMLLENFGKEIGSQNFIENLGDDELLRMRREIIQSLKGEEF